MPPQPERKQSQVLCLAHFNIKISGYDDNLCSEKKKCLSITDITAAENKSVRACFLVEHVVFEAQSSAFYAHKLGSDIFHHNKLSQTPKFT